MLLYRFHHDLIKGELGFSSESDFSQWIRKNDSNACPNACKLLLFFVQKEMPYLISEIRPVSRQETMRNTLSELDDEIETLVSKKREQSRKKRDATQASIPAFQPDKKSSRTDGILSLTERIVRLSYHLKRKSEKEDKSRKYGDIKHIPHPIDKLVRFLSVGTAGWLNDDCINWYLQTLQPKKPTHIYLADTYFEYSLRQSERPERVVKRTMNAGEKYTELVIPINITGNHWFFVLISRTEKKVTAYESLAFDRTERTKTLLNLLRRARTWLADSTDFSHETVIPEQQRNGHDCSIFMLKRIEDVVTNKRHFPPIGSSVRMLRERMLEKILHNKEKENGITS